jgi:DNA replication protein DnaC
MRDIENWNKRVRQKTMERLLSPRQLSVLQDCVLPDVSEFRDTYIFGDTHTGKTILAVAILIEAEKRAYLSGVSIHSIIVNVEDMMDRLKASFDNETPETTYQLIESYKTADVLVLDDFGLTQPTEWVYRKLYQIINHRWENMLMTIYTSNNDLKQVEAIFKDSRIVSRIQRQCVIVKKKPYNTK